MTSQASAGAGARRSYDRIPADVEIRLLKALARNIREYGNTRYNDVREHPEFAPWIGRATGERGRKRFQRLVGRVGKPLPSDTTKPHRGREVNEEQYVWAAEQVVQATAASTSIVPIGVRQIAAGGLPALQGWEALEHRLETAFIDIDRIREAALVADPTAPGGLAAAIPLLLAKAVGLTLAASEHVARYYERYNAIASDSTVLVEILKLFTELLKDDPDRLQEAMRAVRRIVDQHGGVPAAKS